MWIRKTWQASLILCHFFYGMVLLTVNFRRRDPFHPQVREIVRRWYKNMLSLLNVECSLTGVIPHEKDTPAIIIANHISWVDIPLIGSQTPVNFLSKAEVADWPVVGTVAKKLGTLFISRGSGDTERVMHEMKQHLDEHRSILIFPEGTTTDGSKVRRFHKKLFKVCEQTPVDVYPVLIRYEFNGDKNPVPFVGDIGFGSHFWQMLGHGKVHARVETLPPVRLDPEIVGKQLREVELAMRERLKEAAS